MEITGKEYVHRFVEELHNPASKLNIKPRTNKNFWYHPHLVYAEAYGVALFMDVFTPKEKLNGFGIIDIVANGWLSDRHQFIQHVGLGIYDVLCEQGYTVFAVSPGSIQIFSVKQMIKNVQTAVRYVIHNAEKFQISNESIGMLGISAGGHLATCAMFVSFDWATNINIEKQKVFNAIKAVALYAVPFDLVELYTHSPIPELTDILKRLIRKKSFYEEEIVIPTIEIEKRLKEVSPYYFDLARIEAPPYVLLFHGTKDEIVPYSQSKKFFEKLNSHKWNSELLTKKDVPHIWMNMRKDFEFTGKKFLEILSNI